MWRMSDLGHHVGHDLKATSAAKSRRKYSGLPSSLQPRGLSRAAAAGYIGVSISKFNELLRDGSLPISKRFGQVQVWDRLELDFLFTEGRRGCSDGQARSSSWELFR